MEKTKFFTWTAIIAICGLMSCKKDGQGTYTEKRLTRFYTPSDNTDYGPELKYDETGRLIEALGFFDTLKYYYSGSKLVAARINASEDIREITNILDDEQGRIKSFDMVMISLYNGQPQYYKYVLKYNTEGYLEKRTLTMQGSPVTEEKRFSYSDGNLVNDSLILNGQYAFRTEYDYYTDKSNKIELDTEQLLMPFLTGGIAGKLNKNLLKNLKSYAGNSLVSERNYTYQLDAQGYPLQQTLKYMGTGIERTRFYTYNQYLKIIN